MRMGDKTCSVFLTNLLFMNWWTRSSEKQVRGDNTWDESKEWIDEERI